MYGLLNIVLLNMDIYLDETAEMVILDLPKSKNIIFILYLTVFINFFYSYFFLSKIQFIYMYMKEIEKCITVSKNNNSEMLAAVVIKFSLW